MPFEFIRHRPDTEPVPPKPNSLWLRCHPVSFILEPHVLGQDYNLDDFMAGRKVIRRWTKSDIKMGYEHIGLYVEDASKNCRDALSQDIDHYLRTGKPRLPKSPDGQEIERIFRQFGAEYTFAQYFHLRTMLRPLSKNGVEVYGFIENIPSTLNSVEKAFTNLYGQNRIGLSQFRKSLLRSLTHTIARDVNATGQILRELETHHNGSVIVNRGTFHVGLAPALATINERYGLWNENWNALDLPQPVAQINTPLIMMRLMWQKDFWRDLWSKLDLTSLTDFKRLNYARVGNEKIRNTLSIPRWADYLNDHLDVMMTEPMMPAYTTLKQGDLT